MASFQTTDLAPWSPLQHSLIIMLRTTTLLFEDNLCLFMDEYNIYSPPIILREGKVDDVVVLTFSLGAAFVVNGGAAVSNRSAHY